MMKKLTLVLSVLMFCFITSINAQTKEKKDKKTTTTKSKSKRTNAHCWDAGLLGGVTYYNGELHCPDKGLANLRPGGGIYTRYSFNDNFFGRANFQFGQIEGSDAQFEEDWRRQRNFSFSSTFYDAALLLEWEPFGKFRYRGVKKFNRMLSPYIHGGFGGIYAKPKVDWNEPNPIATSAAITADKTKQQQFFMAVPVGGGVRYDLNKNWMLGIEGGFRIVLSDYLDGISEAGNPNKRDWNETLNLTIGYRFPCKRDKDGDGVSDDDDACPDEAGSNRTKGCPDRDNDGVADKADNCPDEAGTAKTFGCPDTDDDNIIDKEDDCPTEKGSVAMKGCPDTDGDGISDKDDKCPTEVGTIEEGGCPVIDTDKDGVADKVDKCPEVAGLSANDGCPDSTSIKKDSSIISQPTIGGGASSSELSTSSTSNIVAAPTSNITTTKGSTPATVNTTNTIISTGSSDLSALPVTEVVILDENGNVKSSTKSKTTKKSTTSKKKTSTTKKKTSKKVQPSATRSTDTNLAAATEPTLVAKGSLTESTAYTTLSSEDEAAIKDAVNGVYFDTNKSTLKSESFSTLSKVATILKRYPGYMFRITGHTDNAGDDLDNVKLSVARARAIYNYLIKKGIDPRSVSYRGCGDGNPIAENETEEGRKQNRRVEFDMMNK